MMAEVAPVAPGSEGESVTTARVAIDGFFVVLYRGFAKAKGWDKVSIFFNVVFYLLVLGIVVNAATDNIMFHRKEGVDYGIRGHCFGFPCTKRNCPCTDSGFTIDFFYTLLFSCISYFLNLIICCASNTYMLVLMNARDVYEEYATFQRLKKDKPIVWDSVHCYHEETTRSTDSEGNTTTSTHTVTTHRETINFMYAVSFDSTDTADLLSLRYNPLTLLTYNLEFTHSDGETTRAYAQHQQFFKSRHVRCDTSIVFSSGVKLAQLTTPSVLTYAPGFDMQIVQRYYLLSMALCCNSLFRLWLLGASVDVTITLRKSISILQNGESGPLYSEEPVEAANIGGTDDDTHYCTKVDCSENVRKYFAVSSDAVDKV